jgi:phospholipid/cholesterol/gamma-HCH transport system ATP-binding protein
VNADNIAELILNLKRQINATLVVVTHDILRAYQFAGRIFLVADQTVIETGTEEETRRHPDPRVQQFIHGYLKGPLTEGREL